MSKSRPVKHFRVLSILTALTLFGPNSFAQESTSRYDVDAGSDHSAWGVSAFALSAAPRAAVNEGGASVFTYFYPSLNYRLGSGRKFALRPVFLLDFYGQDGNGKTVQNQGRTGDMRFVYSDYNMLKLDDYTTFGGSTYWDYPTSESSLSRKIYSKFSGWYQLVRTITPRLNLAYNIKPEWIVNSRSSTRNGRFNNNNKLAEWDHYLELTYDVNRTIAPVASVGYFHEFWQSDPGGSRQRLHEDYFKSGFGSWLTVNRNLRFLGLVQNKVNLRSRNGIGHYRDENEETEFLLLTFASLR